MRGELNLQQWAPYQFASWESVRPAFVDETLGALEALNPIAFQTRGGALRADSNSLRARKSTILRSR